MKFDPFVWREEQANAKIQVGPGRVRVQISALAALYVECEGIEALVGVATSFDFELSEAATVRADVKDARVFVLAPDATSCAPEGEIYTNIDRMPHESGAVAEVVRARRIFEMERRAFLRDLRAERDQLLSASRSARDPVPEPAPEPEVGPEAKE